MYAYIDMGLFYLCEASDPMGAKLDWWSILHNFVGCLDNFVRCLEVVQEPQRRWKQY